MGAGLLPRLRGAEHGRHLPRLPAAAAGQAALLLPRPGQGLVRPRPGGRQGPPPAGPELMGEGRKTPQDAELCSGCPGACSQGSNPALAARASLPPDCERLAIKALIFLKGRAPPPLPPAASVRGGAGDVPRPLPVPGSLPWQPPALQEREQQHGALWGHPSAPRHPLEVLGVPVQAHYPLPISLTTQPALENACWFNQERARPVTGWLRNDGQPRCGQIPEHSRG